MSSKITGTVKFFDAKKGYGFAVNPDGRDVLISHRHMPDTLRNSIKEGDSLVFNQAESENGLVAENIEAE